MELVVKRIMEKEGVTEQLKKENPMEWVRRVDGIKVRVEKKIVKIFICRICRKLENLVELKKMKWYNFYVWKHH